MRQTFTRLSQKRGEGRICASNMNLRQGCVLFPGLANPVTRHLNALCKSNLFCIYQLMSPSVSQLRDSDLAGRHKHQDPEPHRYLAAISISLANLLWNACPFEGLLLASHSELKSLSVSFINLPCSIFWLLLSKAAPSAWQPPATLRKSRYQEVDAEGSREARERNGSICS